MPKKTRVLKASEGPTYLGDGVYASIDAFGTLTLNTDNGMRNTNTIYIEREVLAALEEYLKQNDESAK